VETPDETHVEIRLTRAYLKPGAWLLGPVGPAHSANDGRVSTLGGGRVLVGDGPYVWGPSGRDRVEFLAAEPSKKGEPEPRAKIHRIREIRYPNEKAAVGAFLRGEVAMIEHVPSDRLAEFASNSDVKVGRDTRPSLHRIAIDGRNPVLRNRALRRGLSYAIDRRTLLEDFLLHRSADAANAVSDGAFPRGSYADATDVKPYEHDALLARMLVTAAKKELGGKPIKLTFEYPAIPEAQTVVPKIVEAFQATGLQIVPLERPESELEADLHAGRRC
jgi:peptide/nickel transport system substrate-binding protein